MSNQVQTPHWFNIIHIEGLPQDVLDIKNKLFNLPYATINTSYLMEVVNEIITTTIGDVYTGDILATLDAFEKELSNQTIDYTLLADYWDVIVNVTKAVYNNLKDNNVELYPEMETWFTTIINHPTTDTNYPITHSSNWTTKIGKFNSKVTGVDIDHVYQEDNATHLVIWGYLPVSDEEMEDEDHQTYLQLDGDNLYIANLTQFAPPVEVLKTISNIWDVDIQLISGNGLTANTYIIKDDIITVDTKEPSPRTLLDYLEPMGMVDCYIDKFGYTEDQLATIDDNPMYLKE